MTKMAIENVTDKGDTVETYSIIDNMQPYRVEVEDSGVMTAFSYDMVEIEDDEVANELYKQVTEFRTNER